MSANTVICAGNLVRDPKIFPLKDDSGIVARFTIAIDRPGGGADHIDCAAFGQIAIKLNDRAAKGTPVKLTGMLRSRSYERNGQRTYTMEVHTDTLEITARERAVEKVKRPTPRGTRKRQSRIVAA